jgi:hypothetical protein
MISEICNAMSTAEINAEAREANLFDKKSQLELF